MLFRIEFTNGSETYEHAMNEKEVRDEVERIYPNKIIAAVTEEDWEECQDA